MERKRFEWRLRSRSIQLGERALVAGILDLSPDPVAGASNQDTERAVALALRLEQQGVDILDLVADPLKGGVEQIQEAEELRRLVPVLKKLKGVVEIPVCVTTTRSAVAAKAVEHGAEILHDPSGLTYDAELGKVAGASDVALILSHLRGFPVEWPKMAPIADIVGVLLRELDAAAGRALRSGVDRARIMLDPGLGQGKRREQNAVITANLRSLHDLVFPLAFSAGGKQFLSKQENDAPVTAAAVTAALLSGVHLIRVEDPEALLPLVETAELLLAAVPEKKPLRPSRGQRTEEEDRPKSVRPPYAGMPVDTPVEDAAGPPEQSEEPRIQRPAAGDREERPRRTFAGREDREEKPRRSYGPPREDAGDRPRRSYGPPREDAGDRPRRSYGPPREDAGDRPRRSYGPPREDAGDRPRRSYGPPREGSEDRPKRFGPPRKGAPPRKGGPPRKGAPPRKGPPRKGPGGGGRPRGR